jgi:hypothetical protein
VQLLKKPVNLRARQDARHAGGPLCAFQSVEPGQGHGQRLLVQKQQCRERLILGRRGHVPLAREMVQEGGHLRRAEVLRVTFPGKKDKSLDPVDIRLLGPVAVVLSADRISHLIEQARRTRGRRCCF